MWTRNRTGRWAFTLAKMQIFLFPQQLAVFNINFLVRRVFFLFNRCIVCLSRHVQKLPHNEFRWFVHYASSLAGNFLLRREGERERDVGKWTHLQTEKINSPILGLFAFKFKGKREFSAWKRLVWNLNKAPAIAKFRLTSIEELLP